jgi:hypothetical protein
MENKLTRNFIIWVFVTLYALVSTISTIHVVEFFKLSNPDWLAITLAIAFEVGAAASLASIIALKKMNKGIVWSLFILLTLMQAMGNTYYAYMHLSNYQGWIELFGMVDYEVIEQKRILSLVSGAVLPLVALGFIKSLVDYLRPEDNTIQIEVNTENYPEPSTTLVEAKNDYDAIIKAGQEAEFAKIMQTVAKKRAERDAAGETYENEPTAFANSSNVEKYELDDNDDEEFENGDIVEDDFIDEANEEITNDQNIEDTVNIEETPETPVNPKDNLLNLIKIYK